MNEEKNLKTVVQYWMEKDEDSLGAAEDEKDENLSQVYNDV